MGPRAREGGRQVCARSGRSSSSRRRVPASALGWPDTHRHPVPFAVAFKHAGGAVGIGKARQGEARRGNLRASLTCSLARGERMVSARTSAHGRLRVANTRPAHSLACVSRNRASRAVTGRHAARVSAGWSARSVARLARAHVIVA